MPLSDKEREKRLREVFKRYVSANDYDGFVVEIDLEEMGHGAAFCEWTEEQNEKVVHPP